MLVYGDRSRTLRPPARLSEIATRLAAARQASGVARHDQLTAAFVAGSELTQGLIDAEFEARGEDALTPLHRQALAFVRGLARALAAGDPDLAGGFGPTEGLPEAVRAKTPEGYAFYAVYPEAYRRAALAEAWDAAPMVIGLRSIGVGLAAVVAEAAGAADVVTVRPVDHPYARRLSLAPALADRLAAHPGPFAVADEGPGRSGSSFGAVADALAALGVARARIVFFPSHANDPGPETDPGRRALWARARRRVVTLDDLLRDEPVGAWFEDLIGPAETVEDLSGGAWRALVGEAPAQPALERRKFRLSTPSGRWIARFAGLGEIGEAKFARARALADAGFGPQTPALRRGFLLQRWETGARLDRSGFDRARFLARLARYLAFRARTFPATTEDGATPQALAEMARVNAGACLAPPRPIGPPVHVDGKLDPWEWLVRPDGSFVKLDAVDHSCSHDLVGCQPIAWDVAGAEAAFGLSAAELARLLDAMAAEGAPVSPEALAFHRVCHAAFQRGRQALAGEP
jgi:hypothetical protein